ncbi:MAG: MJ0042-type zinc finger domain-containing protein [Betaproteobacteria bacterium]
MKGSASIPSTPAAAAITPSSCPFCQSSSIVTTAKSPDADSYWRCTECGEVWNASRSQTDRYGGRRWQ